MPESRVGSVARAFRASPCLAGALALVVAAGGGVARAQAASDTAVNPLTGRPDPLARAERSEPTLRQLLEDFNHFVLIRNDELARANAQAILDRAVTPEEFLGVVEDSADLERRFEGAVRAALVAPGLEDVAAQLNALYEQGRLSRARSPEEIARNIDLLTGNQRARLLGAERLRGAGEYAAPQLLQVLLDRGNQARESQVERVLVELGSNSVAPLCAALLGVDPTTQSRLALVLGRIGSAQALPYLYELARTSGDEHVRGAAMRAITQITGSAPVSGISTAELYWDLGEKFYRGLRSLTMFPGESHQLLWTYDPGIGLFPTAIRTEVFHEARAMQLAEKALRLDPAHEKALSLWLAANFSRELDQPEGYDNPAYASDRRDALYYAVMAGAGPTQQVLARALDNHDTRLARRAIEALTLVAGDAGLWAGTSGRRPLLDALGYPDRRVQFDAALALGAAKPTTPFPGSDRVTPILAAAVRDAGARYALVLASTPERQQELRALVEAAGYRTLQAGGSLADASAAVAEAPGVDLIVSDLSTPSTTAMLSEARSSAKMAATPILAMLPVEGWNELQARYETDALTSVARRGLSEGQISERIERLALEASGAPVTEEEAERYAVAALDTLRDLAVSRSEVFRVADAAAPLIAGLEESTGAVRMKIADVLSRIGQRRAQSALMDAALESEGVERIALMNFVASSAKAFGNMLEPRHVREISRLATEGTTEEATSAAALIGALNLERTDLAPLILGAGE